MFTRELVCAGRGSARHFPLRRLASVASVFPLAPRDAAAQQVRAGRRAGGRAGEGRAVSGGERAGGQVSGKGLGGEGQHDGGGEVGAL